MTVPIHTLAVNVTNRCNARCAHCGYWRNDDFLSEIEDPAPFFRLVEDAARIAPGATLALTGGEPFLSPHLLPLVAHARPIWPGKIVVTTNGFAVGQNRVDEVCESGIDELIVSLDGFARTHDQFRGVEGCYEKTWAILDAIHRREQHPLTLALVTISEANIGELRDFFSFLEADPRIARIVFQVITQPMPDGPRDDWYKTDPLWPRDPEYAAGVLDWLIEQAEAGARIAGPASQLRTMRRYFLAPERLVWSACNVGLRYVHVNADGTVRNCVQMPALGSIADESIESILSGPRIGRRLAEMRGCKRNCHFLLNCGFVEGELAD